MPMYLFCFRIASQMHKLGIRVLYTMWKWAVNFKLPSPGFLEFISDETRWSPELFYI
jgi:hypothetical protein